jgi:hypothetical protein
MCRWDWIRLSKSYLYLQYTNESEWYLEYTNESEEYLQFKEMIFQNARIDNFFDSLMRNDRESMINIIHDQWKQYRQFSFAIHEHSLNEIF